MRSLIGCCLLAFMLPCCTLLRASIDSVDLVLVTLAGSRAPLLAAAGHPSRYGVQGGAQMRRHD